jgi:hypothetical protein
MMQDEMQEITWKNLQLKIVKFTVIQRVFALLFRGYIRSRFPKKFKAIIILMYSEL